MKSHESSINLSANLVSKSFKSFSLLFWSVSLRAFLYSSKIDAYLFWSILYSLSPIFTVHSGNHLLAQLFQLLSLFSDNAYAKSFLFAFLSSTKTSKISALAWFKIRCLVLSNVSQLSFIQLERML